MRRGHSIAEESGVRLRWRIWIRRHELPECIEDELELPVILLFEGGDLSGQVLVRRK